MAPAPGARKIPRVIPFPGPRWCPDPSLVQAIDRAAIAAGLPGPVLMESAGRGVVEAVLALHPGPARAVVLVGGGNNGGDGLVAARHLALAGWRVEAVLFVDPAAIGGDAALQWRLIDGLEIAVRRVEGEGDARAAIHDAAGAAVVVDALLGTGLSGPVREPVRSAIAALAEIGVPVVAVDIPSGLDGRTGAIHGVAVRARSTVTFGFPKPGLFLGEGPARAGGLTVVPLGYPRAALAAAGEAPLEWVGLEEARAALPPRRHDAHKGDMGRLLLVAGSERYPGALVLAAGAALRSGVGILVAATPAGAAAPLRERFPEAIVVELPVRKSGGLALSAVDRVGEAAAGADAVAIGPGLTTGAGVREVVVAALAAGSPAVVDADALNVLAEDPAAVERDVFTALTPHPGELGRWVGRDASDVDGDRVDVARGAAGRWGVTVLLKGSPTVVAEPDGRAALVLAGNPGLATGGSGDVLTGLAGSLLAQAGDPGVVLRATALLHALAGDWAAADRGERALVPGDLLAYLPRVIREVESGRGRSLLERLDHPRAALLTAGNGAGA